MNIVDAVVSSFAAALALIFTFIPKLLAFLVIILVGYLVAAALSRAITFLLRKAGFDRVAARIGLTRLEQQMGLRLDAADLLGRIVYWFIFLIFLVPAVDALGLTAISGLLSEIVAFIPNVFVAVLILFLGTLAATFVADLVRGATSDARIGNPSVFANITRYAILGFVIIVALEQLNIAPSILNILFSAIVISAALAFALAFGLGGRDAAKRFIDRAESSLAQSASQIREQQSAQQSITQARAIADVQTNEYRTGQHRAQQPTVPQPPSSNTQPYAPQQNTQEYQPQEYSDQNTQQFPQQ
jgi:hypothetical protein